MQTKLEAYATAHPREINITKNSYNVIGKIAELLEKLNDSVIHNVRVAVADNFIKD